MEEKICWICLNSDTDQVGVEVWKRPCQCRGELKWVHHNCLQRWISEQQNTRGDSTPVSCRICGIKYEVIYPNLGFLYDVLYSVDRFTRSASYMFTGGLVFVSFYWSAVTYGAVTIMQIYGHTKGLENMQLVDPLLLLFGLPFIPVCLIFAKLIPWESYLLFTWENYIKKLPIIRSFINKDSPTWQVNDYSLDVDSKLSEIPRTISSALLLPTISTFIGRNLFKNVHCDLRRVFCGALTYLGIKGTLNVYYRDSLNFRMSHRFIKSNE